METCLVFVDGQKLRTASLLIRLTVPETLQNARRIFERLATKLFESGSEAKRIVSSLHYPTELDVRRVKKFRLVTDRMKAQVKGELEDLEDERERTEERLKEVSLAIVPPDETAA